MSDESQKHAKFFEGELFLIENISPILAEIEYLIGDFPLLLVRQVKEHVDVVAMDEVC